MTPTAAERVLEPAWVRRFRAARVSLPSWGLEAPSRTTYATNASGVWQVVSWDLDRDRHVTLTNKPTGVLGGRVLPDGSGVAWFDDHGGDEVGWYVVTPFDGGPSQPLAPEIGQGWSSGLSLRPGRLAVGVADRDGFALSVRDAGGTRCVYRSERPADVAGLSRDGTLLAVGHTEHGDVLHPALRVLEPATGEPVADLWDGRGNTVAAAGWSPVPGDGRLAVLADASGQTRPHVWHPLSGDRDVLDVDLPGEVWVADWWPDGSALLLGHDHLGRTELYRYDLAAGRLSSLELPDGTIRGARIRPDATLWYAYNSSAYPSQVRARAPGAGGEAGAVPAEDPPLLVPPGDPAPTGAAYRSLHYDNGEGDRVHAFLVLPEPGAGGAPPLVVDVHGGPHAQTTDSFDPTVQAWVDHGFAVLMPNYRGSTGYGKRWEDALEGDPGRPELVDVRAGRDHVVGLGLVDPDRVVLSGASWGGYLTLQGLGTQPGAWSAGVAVVPVADYLSAYADESPGLQEFDRALFGGTPQEKPELYRERSPLTYADQVRAPVLISTGRNDTRCPLRQVENYVEALRARGRPVTLDVYEAGHGSLAAMEQIREQRLALDFLATHLGTAPARD